MASKQQYRVSKSDMDFANKQCFEGNKKHANNTGMSFHSHFQSADGKLHNILLSLLPQLSMSFVAHGYCYTTCYFSCYYVYCNMLLLSDTSVVMLLLLLLHLLLLLLLCHC